MLDDLVYTLRVLAKHPRFVYATALVLALGISINTALFGIVYAAVFRPLRVAAPEELVYIYTVYPRQPDRPTVVDSLLYEYLRDHNQVFTSLTAHWGVSHILTADGESESLRGEWVAGNYFDVLGVKPSLGRTLRSNDDDLALTERSVVISHRLWVRRFKSDPKIVGKEVRLAAWSTDPVTFIVVGVTSPEFKGVSDPWTPIDFWITAAQHPVPGLPHNRFGCVIIARLAPHSTVAQAQAIVAEQGEQWRRTLPSPPASDAFRPHLLVKTAASVRTPLDPSAALVPIRLAAALTVVVATVMLISAVNIVALLLSRGVSRSGELAIRLVIGATRWRVGRQLVIESLILSACGGVLGIVGAIWMLQWFRAWTPAQFDVDAAVDAPVIVAAVLVSAGLGLAIGLVPALRVGRTNLVRGLPGVGIGAVRHRARRLRHWVVLPQLALSLALLLVAAIHVRALLKIELADPGYRHAGLAIMNFTWRMEPLDRKNLKTIDARNAARSRQLYQLLSQRLGDQPGMSAALTTALPLREMPVTSYSAMSQENYLAGAPEGIGTLAASVSPGYFGVMGMSILQGRGFGERDAMTTPRVAIVSASLARRLWPGRDATGHFIAAKNNFPAAGEEIDWLEVVGVVNDVRPVLEDLGHTPYIYTPLAQQWRMSATTIVVSNGGDLQNAIDALKKSLAASEPSAEIVRVRTMGQAVAEILYPRRMAAAILAASGLIGLVLAVIGLYGVVSYSLAQRMHELGVRVALGAARAQIIGMLLREGLTLAAVGSLLGVVLSYPALHVASNFFVPVPVLDVMALATVPVLLTGAVLLACYFPSRRAAAADPMDVLRQF